MSLTRLFGQGGRRSLFSAMVLVACVGLAVPATLIGVFVVGVRVPELAQAQQRQDMQARLELLSTSLPYLMWTFDETSIRDVAEAVMASPDVVRVVVSDKTAGTPIIDLRKPGAQVGTVHHGARDILFRDKAIGRVELAIDDRLVLAAQTQQRWLYAATVGGQVLVSLALILMLLNSRFAKPLRRLEAFADQLAQGQFQARLGRRHDDEIGRLGGRLEHMRGALQRLSDEQRSLLTRLRAEEAATLRQTRFFEALSRSNRLIVRQQDPGTLYTEICRICVETGHAVAACVHETPEGQSPRLVASAGRPLSPGAEERLAPEAATPGTTHVVHHHLNALPETARAQAQACGFKAMASFPIHRGGGVVASLSLYASETDVFDEAVVALLDEMVGDLSFALDNADRESARVVAVNAVQAGYARFQRVFGTMPLPAMIRALDDGQLLEVNEAACQWYGLDRQTLVGARWDALQAGPTDEELHRLTALIQRDGQVRNAETRVRLGSGAWRDVLFHGERIEFGGRECALIITLDITDRKRMENELRDSAARIAGIVETAMDAIVTVDASYRVVVFNQAASRMFRLATHEALGRTLDAFIPVDLRGRHMDPADVSTAPDQLAHVMTGTLRLAGLRSDGSEFPLEASISRSGEGERLLMTVTMRDITAELEAEKALQARLAAEAASRAKTDFLSRMSHELRTPLNAVLGFSQLLQADRREPLSERQKGQVELIRQAGWHLLALINDVLDVSRIEAGNLSVQSLAIDLPRLLDEVLPLVQELAERHSVTLEPLYRHGPACQVMADPVRLRQVVLNVVSNAVKYNRHGGTVYIGVQPGPRQASIVIEDTGIGMTQDQLAHLFEPFNRLGREHGSIEGTGIGMALSRQLAELMKGSLQVDSTVGVGTRVRVEMPVEQAPEPVEDKLDERLPVSEQGPGQDQTAAPHVPLSTSTALVLKPLSAPRMVLYIEDNPVNAMIVEQLLLRWPDISCRHAGTAAEGLALARTLTPSLVLLDIGLPDMDGLQVLRTLQSDPETQSLRVVVLSASAMPEDVALALKAGAREYWTKPLDFERFVADIQRLLPD